MMKALKFNPGFQTDEEAVANFVVRAKELSIVLDVLGGGEKSARVLIVAPRGAGKTTLCRRVLAETRGGGRLAAGWQAIDLGEESYAVTTPGEFFLECLFHLRDQVKSEWMEGEYARAVASDSEVDLLAATLGVLRRYRAEIGKRLLIIVENFHTILVDQIGSQGGAVLLAALKGDDFGVLATSVVRAPEDEDFINPEDYVAIPLNPLSLDECQALWVAYTGREAASDKIRPLQILTGGSPRLLHILAEFMKTPSLHDLMDNLNFLIDQNTEYFKNQLDALAPVERKVFAALLDLWDPSSAKQVAEAARVNINTASSMLSRLADKGAVVKEPGKGRQAIYYASERLFNIYYLMRRRSNPSNRVRALVSFMTEYYDRDELVDTTALLVREACSLEPGRRDDYHSAFAAIISKAPEGVRRKILEQTPQEFIQPFRDAQRASREELVSQGQLVASNITSVVEEVERASDEGDFRKAENLLRQLSEDYPDRAEPWVRLALLLQFRVRDAVGALEAAEKARELEPEDPWVHAVLGMLLMRTGRDEEAVLALRRSVELDPRQVMAVPELARHYEETGEIDLAIEIFAAARARGKLHDAVLSSYAHLLIDAGRGSEAVQILLNDVRSDDDLGHSRRILANYLCDDGRGDEAATILRNAAAHSDKWGPWADLGVFLLDQNDTFRSEAKSAIEHAMFLGADIPVLFEILADAKRRDDEPEEEISSLASKVMERAPDDENAFISASKIYRSIGRLGDAEEALARAVGRGMNAARVHLAKFLHDEYRDEARTEALLREAVAAEPKNCRPAKDLAEFLVHGGNDTAAEKVLSDNLERHSDCFCSLILHGQICTRRRDKEAARASFEAAREIDRNAIPVLTGLAAVAEPDEALALIAEAIAAGPSDPRPLLARAHLGVGTLEDRIADAERALEIDPDFTDARLLLAPLLVKARRAEAAIGQLATALDQLVDRRELIPAYVGAAMAVAAGGLGQELSTILEQHDEGRLLEPLRVALQLTRGEQPLVAKEVLEVAQDIVRRSKSDA